MGGRGLGGLLAIGALSGCSLYFGQEQAPDAGPPDAGPGRADASVDYTATLDVDLLVHPSTTGASVFAYLAEVDRPCDCAAGGFPHEVGSCAFGSDVPGCWCDPSPAACLRDLTVERDGQIAELVPYDAEYDPSVRVATIPGTGTSAVVHVRGCGADTDLTIPVDVSARPPVLGTLSADWDVLHVPWTNGPPPIAALVSCYELHSLTCHEIDGQRDFDWRCGSLAASTINGGEPVQTNHGEFRVWQSSESYFGHLYYPEPAGPGRWSLGSYGREVTVSTPTATQTLYVNRSSFDGSSQPIDTSIQFAASWGPAQLRYAAGPVTDSIEWSEGSEVCSATVPHISPPAPIEPGNPYSATTLALTLPPTDLTCDIGGPEQVGFDLSWVIGVIVVRSEPAN